MPTKPVCDTFDKLRQDAVGLLSLWKHLKSKQNEAQALRERYEHTNGQEYKSITTPGTLSGTDSFSSFFIFGYANSFSHTDRPGDAALGDGDTAAGFGAAHAQAISKGTLSTFIVTCTTLFAALMGCFVATAMQWDLQSDGRAKNWITKNGPCGVSQRS
ncbi:hypothetical protein DVH05_015706 [Phytophthora capsici]|nr:hypothetical protein DVH05_015706 [Phytophthora capsici]